MDYLKGYIRSLRYKKVNQKICIDSSDFEKIITFDEKGKTYKDEKVKKFYEKYEKELNSYKMDDLMKIFKKTGICIYRTLRCLRKKDNPNEKDVDIGGFTIQPTSIYYWNSQNFPKVEYNYIKKKYRKQEKELSKLQNEELDEGTYLKSGEYDYFFIDMEFVTYVDELGKDNIGIYMVNNNKKEYVCLFDKLED